MPSISTGMLSNRLPSRPSIPSASDLTANLKNESSKLLNRITCNFFDRASNAQSRRSSQPVRHERRTIQTNYISTISSLVDKDNSIQLSNEIAIESSVLARHSPHADAQCDNYGLYALKHNRNACRERRPPAKVPPPVPPPPAHRKLIPSHNCCDIVHEKFQSIESRIVAHPIVEQPRRKSDTEDVIRRPRKCKAPLPKKAITRSITIDAQRNTRSAMVLDTQLLEPPDENLRSLTKNNSELYRIAVMHFQHSSLEDSTSATVQIANPLVTFGQAHSVKQNVMKMSRKQKRNRLVKQLSTTDSINIFQTANRQADAFEDFNDELNFEPIVPVPSQPDRRNSFVSHFEQPTESASPQINYANRFAVAFAEAFSEEDGITDFPPTPSPPPPPLPQSAQPIPTTSYQRRLSNPLVFASTSACDNHQERVHKRLSLPAVSEPSLPTEPSPNLITNSTRFTIQDDDNNTTSSGRLEDASNPTQLRSSGQPDQMRMPIHNALEYQNINNDDNSSSKVATTTKTRPTSITASRRQQHHHQMMTISERRKDIAKNNIHPTTAMGHQFYPSAQAPAVDTTWEEGFVENCVGGEGVEVLDVAAPLPIIERQMMLSSKSTTRRTVYVMNI